VFDLLYLARAEEDLSSIYVLIAEDSPERAFDFIERIQRRCDLLRQFPEQGRARPELRPNIRILPYGRSVVIAYQIVGNTIEIVRIFYGGQLYETLLGEDAE
jgi:toxin ParE1/3/4